MAFLPELQYCCQCRVYLGPDNCDGICSECERTACEEGPERCGSCLGCVNAKDDHITTLEQRITEMEEQAETARLEAVKAVCAELMRLWNNPSEVMELRSPTEEATIQATLSVAERAVRAACKEVSDED